MSITYVQGNGTSGNSSSLSVTLGSSTPIGNLIVVGLVSNSSISNVTDNQGNIYTRVKTFSSAPTVEIWYSKITVSGTLTITVSGTSFAAVTVDEFSAPGSDFWNAAAQSGTSNTPTSSNVSVSGTDFIYGVVVTNGAASGYTAGSTYTTTYSVAYSNGVNYGLAAEYLLNTSSNPANPGFTLGASPPWKMVGASFGVGNPASRISQIGLLVIDQGTPKARISQIGLLVIDQGTPKARISQTGLLVITQVSAISEITLNDSLTFSQSVLANTLLNKTLNQSLTLTQSVSVDVTSNTNIDQSLIFIENVSVDIIFNKNISQSLTFVQSVLLENTLNKTLNQSLTLAQSISTDLISNKNISQSLTFTQNVVATKSKFISQILIFSESVSVDIIFNRSISQFLTITDYVENFSPQIFQTLTFSQSLSKSIIRHKSFLQSLVFTQSTEYLKVIPRDLKQKLIFSQNLSTKKTKVFTILDQLIFTDAVKIPNKSLNININQVLLFKGGGGYHSDHGLLTKTIDNTVFTYTDVIAIKVVKYVVLQANTQIILPSPLFGDSRTNLSSMTPLRMVDGSIYTYVKTTKRQRLIYQFELKRQKANELQRFLDDNDLLWLQMDNFKGERWIVRIVNNPITFEANSRGYVCGETQIIELQFEGFRIGGAATSC